MPSSSRTSPLRVGYTLTAIAAIAAAAAAIVLPGDPSRAERRALVLTAGRGSTFELRTSSTGNPILTAPGLVPGATASGRIQVRNTGDQTMVLRLVRKHLVDVPGPNGGKLSEALQVQIVHIRTRRQQARPRTAYTGPVRTLRQVRLKQLKPRVKRTYEFVVTMPDNGIPSSASGGDNAYQGSSASVDFVWRGLPAGR